MRWSQIDWARVFRLMLIGSVAFWLPDILVQAVAGHRFNGLHVWVLTAVMPLTFLLTWIRVKKGNRGNASLPGGGVMLAGVWIFGGFFMMLSQSFSGGGFNSPDGIRWVLASTVLSVFPFYTFMLSTYDGTLGVLLLVTLGAGAIAIMQLLMAKPHKDEKASEY